MRNEVVRVLAPEDFVIFKVLSTRERDLEDAASVVRGLGTILDLTAVEREVSLLKQEIPEHDTVARFARVTTLAGAPTR